MANKLKILKKENNIMEKQLNDYNKIVLTDMILYLYSSNLKEYDIEVIQGDLISMALEYQLRGEDLKKAIGCDYKEFCNELIKNAREKTLYEKILEKAYIIIGGIGILYLYEIFFSSTIINIFKSGSFTMPITLGFIGATSIATVAAFYIYWYTTKKSFELTKPKMSKDKVFILISGIFIWVLAVIMRIKFDKTILFSINCLYPLAFFATAFGMVWFLNNKNIDKVASKGLD